MRDRKEFEQYKRNDLPSCANGAAYQVNALRIIVADVDGWDHVSVSLETRTPSWEEMEFVKRIFFKPTEWAVQYHPAMCDYINTHPNVLHIWRPQFVDILHPPTILV